MRFYAQTSQQQRARGQRRASTELGSILGAYPDLPCIAWTIAPAGPVLVGHVNGLAPAVQVRQDFDSWRCALGLREDRWQQTGYGTVFLHASARRNQVTVRLTATVFDEQPQDGL